MTRKPPSETSDPDPDSRRARLVARRHRRTRIIVAVVVLVVAGAAAFAAYAVNDKSPQAQAAGSEGIPTTSFGVGGTIVPSAVVKPAAPPRTLDHNDPLRLWVGGDSLAGSFGPALGDRVGETGVVKTRIDYRVSSGLWSNDIRNWYERATEQMASDDPEAVVFIIGTNDTPVVNQVDGNGDGVPDWEAVYRMKIARMMDLFVGPNHRTVFWLGPPTLGTRVLDRGAKAIGEVMRQEAAKRAPDVVYLDTYKLFSTSDGSYSRSITDENGKEIVARISDGTHFTEDGAQYLARAVFALLDARWEISKHADLLHPIGFTIASGSGESVPGFSTTPKSKYGSGGNGPTGTTYPSGTSTTAPESSTTSTAPPTTIAPTTVSSTKRAPTTTAPPSTVATSTTVHHP